MPWVRHLLDQPPAAQQIESGEREGWAFVQIIGPCPAIEDKPDAKPRMLYIVYLRRSIVEVAHDVPRIPRIKH